MVLAYRMPAAGYAQRGIIGLQPSRVIGNPDLRPPQQAMGATQDDLPAWFYVVDTASMAASAYHGYKRNNSIGWALWWGLMGAMFPIITPTIALAQGFGKRKAVANRRRRSRR